MGKKIVNIVCGIAVLASVLQVIAAFLPMYKNSLIVAGGMGGSLGVFEVHLTSITFNKPSSLWQTYAMDKDPTATEHSSWFSVDRLQGSHPLDEARMHMCTPALKQFLWPGLCQGLESAWGMGIALIVILCASVVCQACGCYLLYDYAFRKQNPKYREIAAAMVLSGGAVFLFTLVAYGFAALGHLNDIGGGITGWVLGQSEASGTASGYIVFIVSAILQLIEGVLLLAATQNEWGEEDYLDRKDAREVELEMGRIGQGGGQQQPQMMQPPVMLNAGGMVVVQQQPMAVPMVGAAAW